MAGIYLHIPYCKQKCHYCNFYSLASHKYRHVFVDALLKELDLRQDYLADKHVNTIYFGGGTPSLLQISEITHILNALGKYFEIDKMAEITLETNPDDCSADYLKALKNETPVNRLSIGVQSFFDDDLQYLHRVHQGVDARRAIEAALKSDFKNMSIDLIYGIPGLTAEKWKQNLSDFFSYNIPHLSSYALTVESKTALQILISKNKLQNTKEEEIVQHFEILSEETQKQGFVHYEISNFAKPGFYSKHNSTYWLGGHYLGLGPSAHSFNGISRQWNVANMKQYIESDTVDKIVQEKEILTEEQRYNEYIMTSLRTSWGCDAEHIQNVFGEKYVNLFREDIQKHVKKGRLIQKGSQFVLSEAAKLFADGIAADLFVCL